MCHSRFTTPPRLLLAILLLASTVVRAEPLVIGAEDDWYPYTASRDGVIQGMSVDIVKATFAACGTPVELVAYPYARCMRQTLQGELAGCFNTAPDARIGVDYRLPREPLFSADILLWALRENAEPVNDLESLRSRRVAVTLGYEYGDAFDGLRDLQRIPVRKDLNGFLMLAHHRVDYVVAYRDTAEHLFRETPSLQGRFAAVGVVNRPLLYLSFSRRHPQAERLLRCFEEGMQRIRADGRYQAILRHWRHEEDDSPAR